MLGVPRPTCLRRRARAIRAGLFSCVVLGLVPLSADAQTELITPVHDIAPKPETNERWRASGLAHLDLPMRFRARLDASYSRRGARFRSERLAERLAPPSGPAVRTDRALTSRVSLTRPIIEGIEFEISWAVRNRLRAVSPDPFESHAITAGFRFAPTFGQPALRLLDRANGERRAP